MPPEQDVIALALAEDIGEGDVTTLFFTDARRVVDARVVARQACVIAGLGVAKEVFRRVGPELAIQCSCDDGARLQAGDVAMTVRGRAASILTAERTALNFLQRLSGVATLASRFVAAVQGTSAKILDTRKTTPGMRALEKAAVLAAGAQNHRIGLYDMVMVKDNHLAGPLTSEDLQAAISRVKAERPGIRVELEADTVEQVRQFAALDSVDVILLDNMTVPDLRAAVALRKPGLFFEASGGVTLKTVRQIAETGVDFISVGEMTHSAPAVDLSLEIAS